MNGATTCSVSCAACPVHCSTGLGLLPLPQSDLGCPWPSTDGLFSRLFGGYCVFISLNCQLTVAGQLEIGVAATGPGLLPINLSWLVPTVSFRSCVSTASWHFTRL